jgi:hypothetical protein
MVKQSGEILNGLWILTSRKLSDSRARSIVSGLRNDEDDESIYNGRTSFVSEYSAGTQGGQTGQDWDQMQVTVREHARSSSRGSYSSFALKSKREASQSKSRPETKVRVYELFVNSLPRISFHRSSMALRLKLDD